MTWYEDPDVGPPPMTPMTPPPAGAPPAPQQYPTAQPQPPAPQQYPNPPQQYPAAPQQYPAAPQQYPNPPQQYPAAPQQPYGAAPPSQYGGPPQGPPGPPQPPAGKAPGGGWRSTFTPLVDWAKSGRNLAILGTTIGAAIAVVAGLVWFGGPDEMSTREYARAMCTDVLRPASHDLEKVGKSRGFRLVTSNSISRASEAEKGIAAVVSAVGVLRDAATGLEKFNANHVLRDRDGEQFRSDLETALPDYTESLDNVLSDVHDLDPQDEEDVLPDLHSAIKDLGGLDISIDADELGGDVMAALSDANSSCATLLAVMIYGNEGGD